MEAPADSYFHLPGTWKLLEDGNPFVVHFDVTALFESLEDEFHHPATGAHPIGELLLSQPFDYKHPALLGRRVEQGASDSPINRIQRKAVNSINEWPAPLHHGAVKAVTYFGMVGEKTLKTGVLNNIHPRLC